MMDVVKFTEQNETRVGTVENLISLPCTGVYSAYTLQYELGTMYDVCECFLLFYITPQYVTVLDSLDAKT